MNLRKSILISFLLLFSFAGSAQKTFMDKQLLKSGRWVWLYKNMNDPVRNRYLLVNTNHNYSDSVKIFIDSIDFVPCDGPASIFFLNDSIGFFTQSGGCYAYYNLLYRTSDGGHTWKEVMHEVGNDIPASLGNTNFFMFNPTRGIIIWKIEGNQLHYSETWDGGTTWKLKSTEVNNQVSPSILSIEFSVMGQVVILTGSNSPVESDKQDIFVLQSKDFGNSFQLLK